MGDGPSRALADAGGDRLKAFARIVAECVDGRTVHRVLHAESPMALRRVDDAILFVSTAAHPVGGDDLALRIDVGAGARVVVRSVAAMVVWPGPSGEWSRLRIEAAVAAGGHLEVAPEPAVAVRGCRHRTEVRVTLADDATLRWREDVVLGRTSEEPGRFETSLRIERGGRPLLVTGTRVGGDTVAWDGPAVTAGHDRLRTEVTVAAVGPTDEGPVTFEGPGAVIGPGGLRAVHMPAAGLTVASTLGPRGGGEGASGGADLASGV